MSLVVPLILHPIIQSQWNLDRARILCIARIARIIGILGDAEKLGYPL